jgi:hypothetical protein
MLRGLLSAGLLLVVASRCSERTDDVPCITVPHCSRGHATATDYKLCATNVTDTPARQRTKAEICWGDAGLQLAITARDSDIFNSCEACNCPVYARGSVLEVFVAPVKRVTDNPRWYAHALGHAGPSTNVA